MRWSGIAVLTVLALGILTAGGPSHAQNGAAPDMAPKVRVSLVPEHAAVVPGGTTTVALQQVIRKGWHTYWRNPGDSGAATTIAWQLPPGWKAGDIQWPYPGRLPFGPLVNFGYSDQATLLVDITAPADAKPGETVTLPAKVNWLVCSDVCIPEETELDVTLGVAAVAPTQPGPALFARARQEMPRAAPWPVKFQADGTRFALLVESRELAAARPREAAFFPIADGVAEPSAEIALHTVPEGVVVESRAGRSFANGQGPALVDGVLVLTGADGRTDAFAVSAAPGVVPVAASSGVGLLQALLFAFVGGLILNLMPCVLPVLSMKALALAKHTGAPAAAKRETLAYAAGVIVSFLALAGALIGLRAAGSAIGWGFQLQQPVFVAGLALLMFAVGLNLSGLYQFGIGRVAGAGQSLTARGGETGSFFTGVLAVVVATPCTAPFMAAALGFALTQSAGVSLAVFFALALGFAAPFMALGLSPRARRWLPRPGPWMDVFKQALAFPMYGTAVWLTWVVSQQVGPDGLLALLAAAVTLAFGLWAYGASMGAQRGRTAGLATAALALLVVCVLTARLAQSTAPSAAAAAAGDTLAYEPYSASRLASLRAEKTPIFVNATAAWCITCLVNDRVALSGDSVERAFAERGVVALKADWTNQNPEITALLSDYGRSGVPLYLYFAPGASRAQVLPQILTESSVLAAVQAGT